MKKCIFVLTLLVVTHVVTPRVLAQNINIGVLAHRGHNVAVKMWSPTADYLSTQIPNYNFHVVPLTNDTIRTAVKENKVDFLLTNPASYAGLEAEFGITRMATLRNRRHGGAYTEFGGLIIARADRKDISSLEDLKHRSFMAVHQDAFGGWWMAWRELKLHGINPHKDFTQLIFAGFPQDKIVMAVKEGKVDAGTVRTDILERMAQSGKIKISDFKILNQKHNSKSKFPFIHSTRLYPEWPFATLADTPQKLAQQVTIALLSLPETSNAALSANSAGWTVPSDYQTVHDLMKYLRVGPYKSFGSFTVTDVIKHYRTWIQLGLVALLLMIGTIIYVLKLNYRIAHSQAALIAEVEKTHKAKNEIVHLGQILDNSSNEIYIFSTKSLKFIQVNQGAVHNLGYEMDELRTMTPVDIKPEFTKKKFRLLIAPLIRGQKSKLIFETIHKRKNNTTYPVQINLQLSNVLDPPAFVAIIADISERIHNEQTLFIEKERAQVTLESIGDAVITTDTNGIIEYINPKTELLTGYSNEEVVGQPLSKSIQLLSQNTGMPIEDPISGCLNDDPITDIGDSTILLSKDNHRFVVQETVSPRRNASGKIIGVVIVLRDITELQKLQNQMTYFATHDDLTGLINRRAFEGHIAEAIYSTKEEHKQHALLYMDLDQFKVVNDTCGHAAGDALLKKVSADLHTVVRSSDYIARLGGDEFAVLLHSCDIKHASTIAESIKNVINNIRFVWNKQTFQIGASIGIAAITEDSVETEGILSAADSACYVAKDAGRNQCYVFQTNDEALNKRKGDMQWTHRIKSAIEENRLILFCQMIQDLENLSKPIAHYEVLVRLVDEHGELVQPGRFIPAAERYQLMYQIDRWVVSNTLKIIANKWFSLPKSTRFSINVSGQSLVNPKFIHHVIGEIDANELSPEQICFEITETAAIANFQQAVRFMTILRGMGCQFSLDDFGSGMSSFSYLKNLPVDNLKIDGSFVKNIAENYADYAMVKAITQVARSMGMKTIAEFVENDIIIGKLQGLKVDFAQGHAIGKPQPLADFIVFKKSILSTTN